MAAVFEANHPYGPSPEDFPRLTQASGRIFGERPGCGGRILANFMNSSGNLSSRRPAAALLRGLAATIKFDSPAKIGNHPLTTT
jgi:hypothetical protein